MDDSTIKDSKHHQTLPIILLASLGISGILLIYVANSLGLWWFTILTGLIIGLLVKPGRRALVLSLLIGGVGWTIGLVYQAFILPVPQTATLIAELLGFGKTGGWVVIAATILLGVILCESGTWFGLSLKSLLPPQIRLFHLRKSID